MPVSEINWLREFDGGQGLQSAQQELFPVPVPAPAGAFLAGSLTLWKKKSLTVWSAMAEPELSRPLLLVTCGRLTVNRYAPE